MAQNSENGFARLVQLECCVALQITLNKPELATDALFALQTQYT